MTAEMPSQTTVEASADLLYHYTTERGLLGILDSSEIWPTHIRFLNDLSEQNEGSLLFEREFKLYFGEKAKGLVLGDRDSLFLNYARIVIKNASEQVGTYLMSFTEDKGTDEGGDRLSQWRGYGPGISGVCLGFDRRKLEAQVSKWATAQGVHLSILKCIYTEGEKISGARQLLNQISSLLAPPSPGDTDWPPNSQAISDFSVLLNTDYLESYMTWLAQCKHVGFSEENEARIVARLPRYRTDLVSFRDGRFTHMPHLRIQMNFTGEESPLRQLVVGPSQDQEQSVVKFETDLAKRGIHGVKVRPSQIPYRSW